MSILSKVLSKEAVEIFVDESVDYTEEQQEFLKQHQQIIEKLKTEGKMCVVSFPPGLNWFYYWWKNENNS